MDYRTGKCSQCGAEYKVPASFAHNAARCKVCKGVVHLSPAPRSAQPAAPDSPARMAVPAKTVVRKPAPPAASPRKGPPSPAPAQQPASKGGTLERLRKERAAAAADEGSSAAGSSTTPRTRSSSAKGASTKGASTKEKVRAGTEARASARRERARHKHDQKKKAPVLGILSGVALIVGGSAVFLFKDQLFGNDTAEADTVAAAPTATSPEPEPVVAATEPEPEAAEPEVEAPAEKPKAEPKPKDPSSIDLLAYADFEGTPDTSAEEWAQMNEWMTTWMDIEAGAAGNRGKLALIREGRKAVPVILNQFKRQDFATKGGRSNGDLCQKTLQQISNGANYGWRYADEADGRPLDHPGDVYYCKRVAELWIKAWLQVEVSIEAWINMAKLEAKDPAEARRLRELYGAPSASEDDLELDLDVD